MNDFDPLKLENQLCFPLYAASKELVRRYKPHLDKLDLTYTQYIAMMVMWEHTKMNVKELGEYLFLDSGTLTPLLKTLEKKGLVTRARSKEDERNLVVCVTEKGMALRDKALEVPKKVAGCIQLDEADAKELYILLHKLMKQV